MFTNIKVTIPYMLWFVTNKCSMFIITQGVNDTIQSSTLFNLCLSLIHYVLTLHKILSFWSLWRLLTIIWSQQCNVDYRTWPTVDLINFGGTWNSPHHVMHDLKFSIATLALHCFVTSFGLCYVWFTVAMRARLSLSPAPLYV